MDAAYEFDAERRIVIITIHGELTDEGLLEGYDRLTGDPRFRRDYDQLIDLRGAAGGQITAEGVRAFVVAPSGICTNVAARDRHSNRPRVRHGAHVSNTSGR